MANLSIPPEQIALYRQSAQRRKEQEQADVERLRDQDLAVAHCAAALLRERFHVTRVVVFGSAIHKGCFTRWSDIDIAAWGIAPEDTFRAIGAVMDLDNPFKVNLVDVNTCRPSLLHVIEQDGIDL
jgi:uncharacterized protein